MIRPCPVSCDTWEQFRFSEIQNQTLDMMKILYFVEVLEFYILKEVLIQNN